MTARPRLAPGQLCEQPFKLLGVILAVTVLPAPRVAAQQPPAAPVERTQEAGEEDEEPRNEAALVLAGTHEEDEASFTIGGEYERRLSRYLGIITELEFVSGPDSLIVAVPFVVHPAGGLKLFTGPGVERAEVHEENGAHESETGADDEKHENLFLWRVGAGYSWELGRFVVGPSISFDFIHEHEEWKRAFVFGVSLGVAF